MILLSDQVEVLFICLFLTENNFEKSCDTEQ